MQERPNYYLLLDLDPLVDDWAAIEKRILEKKRQWSSDKTMGNPAARRKAEHNLQTIRDIEETLKNPEERKQEAKEARRQKEAEGKAKLDELSKQIPILKANGRCSEEEFKTLVKNFSGFLTDKQIEKMIRDAGIPIAGITESAEGETEAPKEFIDPVTVSNIRRNLDHLKLANLYEFLKRSPKSSPKSLRDGADQINKEILAVGKIDTDSSARKELAGICLSIFRSDKEKEKYDNTLSVEAMDHLKPQIELAGSDGFIISQEMDEIVKQAVEKGVQREDAIAYVKNHARKRKWKVQVTGSLSSGSLKQCRYCFTLVASASATHCSKCGEDLSLACPQCTTVIPAQDNTCSNCGCYPGDAPVVRSLFQEAQRMAIAGDLAGAVERLNRAAIYWPTWKPLLLEREKFEARQKERESELRTVEALANARNLIEARSVLDRLTRSYGIAGLEEIGKRIRDNLARAEAAFREAEQRRAAGREEDAVDKYEEALSMCADFEQARQAMAACPPPPPTGLQFQPVGNGIRLSWCAVTARGSISYRVIRKAHGLPNNEMDGERVGDVQNSRIDDMGIESGTPWFYSVFTLRGGVASRTSVSSGPHLVAADVINLSSRTADREVTINWEIPKGCRRVEVWRKNGEAPARPGDGVRVSNSRDSAHDTGLINGTSYGYLVVAVFDDPGSQGKELYSPGSRFTVFPVAPPAPITDLTCVHEEKMLMFKWTPVAGASVQIRQTNIAPSSTAGLIVSLEEANRVGSLVATSSTGSAQASLSLQGRLYFIPLTVVAGTAVIGTPVVLTTIEDVVGLKAQAAGQNIVLTWNWPSGIDEVCVCYTHDKYPSDPVSAHSTRVRVTRQEYDRAGFWELRGALRKPHYFTVFSKAGNNGIYSKGAKVIESMGQSTSVTYRVVLKKALLSRSIQEAWLELHCTSRASLGGLLVIGKPRNVPLSPADGTLISEVSEVSFLEGRARIPIPQPYRGTPTYVKLFFKDPRDAQEIRLLPAAKAELRLD